MHHVDIVPAGLKVSLSFSGSSNSPAAMGAPRSHQGPQGAPGNHPGAI